MTASAEATCEYRGALALRAWCLHRIAAAPKAPDGSAPVSPGPPSVSDAAWRIFLGRERCASVVLDAVGSLAGSGPGAAESGLGPGHGPGAVLRALAREEALRSLSVRAQLQRIGELMGPAGIDVVALKGGVTAALGGRLHLLDVDVLVEPGRAREAARLLERSEGFVPIGPDGRVGARGMAHLATRVARGKMPVEVHFSLQHFHDVEGARRRAVPLGELPGVRRFAAPDHLRHLLVHTALQHPERLGRLRDLILLRDEARACTPGELDEVRGLVAGGAGSGEVAPATMLLAMATALADGRAPHDPFRRTAAVGYLRAARPRRGRWSKWVDLAAMSMVEGAGGYLRMLRFMADPWDNVSSHGWLSGLERRLPPVGRSVRIAGSVARFTLASVPAAAVVWRARRMAADAAG